MGLMRTRWEATYQGRPITVARNEMTRGFEVSYGGQTIGTKKWSWIGSGTVEGRIEDAGRSLPVVVRLGPFRCRISVDGQALPVTKLK